MVTEQTVAPLRLRQERRKGAERRQQIVDAARRILIDAGVGGLVLRDVAERIGITHGNVQYYFATKEDLIVAIFEQEITRYTSAVHTAIRHSSSRHGAISALIDEAVGEIRGESTTLWMMLFSLARQNSELCKLLRDTYDTFDETLAEELATVAPELSKLRRVHIAQIIRMLFDGLGVQSAYADLGSPAMLALLGEIKATITSLLHPQQALR
jgi:AcrR family transcriptional regulator